MNNNKGFTLVELSIVIAFSGVFALIIGAFFRSYTTDLQRETTVENIELAHQALWEYFGRNGVYPCPADPTLGPGDALYGVAQCRDYTAGTYNIDTCDDLPTLNMNCTVNFSRDADNNGSNDVVLMGVIPFQTLIDAGLDTQFRGLHRKDGYNTLYSYAVSENMTNDSLYSINFPAEGTLGAIRVVDENDIPTTDPADSAHYVLYSHGDNGRGGFAANSGNQIDNCNVTRLDGTVGLPDPGGPTTAPSGIDIEIENCDYNDAIFLKGIRSVAAGGDYNDDILLLRTRAFRPYWRASFSNTDHIFNTNFGNVGIGTETPSHKLHIEGDLAVEGQAEADEGYCQGTSTTCLDPEFLGGAEETNVTQGRNTCPAGQAAYAIGDDPNTAYEGAEIICRDVDWTPINKSCQPLPPTHATEPNANTFLRGISNLGNILCCTHNTNACEEQ